MTNQLKPLNIENINEQVIPTVDDFLGKPLLILFYNLICPGCVGRAVPFANRMALEHQGELNVIGIHSTFEGSELSDSSIITKMDELYTRFAYYRDVNLTSTFDAYQAAGTPHWFLADKNGKIIQNIFGSDPNRALLRLDLTIAELINN